MAKKRVLITGGSSFDIQGAANELTRSELFPKLGIIHELKITRSDPEVDFVVTPGFADYCENLDMDERAQQIEELIAGFHFHLIVAVFSYPFKWVEEDRQTAEYITKIVSSTKLKDQSLFVLTTNDTFRKKYPGNIDEELRKYLKQQENAKFQEFRSMFKDFLILEVEGEENNHSQVMKFRRNLAGATMAYPINIQVFPVMPVKEGSKNPFSKLLK